MFFPPIGSSKLKFRFVESASQSIHYPLCPVNFPSVFGCHGVLSLDYVFPELLDAAWSAIFKSRANRQSP